MQRTSLGVVLCLMLVATAIFAADAKPTEGAEVVRLDRFRKK